MIKVNVDFIRYKIYQMRMKNIGEFLERIGMNYNTFNKRVKGETSWKLDELNDIAACLNCDVMELLEEDK